MANSSRRRTDNKGIIVIALSLVVIVAIIVAVVLHFTDNSKNEPAGETTVSQGTVKETETTETTKETVQDAQNNLEMNAYPQINELINEYRQAFAIQDIELLKKVYNTSDDISTQILTSTAEIIEGYENTVCYTKKGLEEGDYAVFVYNDLKLVDIETLAPNISVFYVKTSEEGKFYIYRGEYNRTTGQYQYNAETQAFIESLYLDDDVVALVQSVNTMMDSACAMDPELEAFMDTLRSKVDQGETAFSAAESAETETEETLEGTSQSDTESETTSE